MSLPTGGPWPPTPHDIALRQQAVWSAWWVGDPDGLRSAYSDTGAGGTAAAYTAARQERPSESLTERQGGILPTIARLFWGRPSTGAGRKAGLHVPLAADLATASADLLFSEPPQFILEGETEVRKAAGENYKPSPAQARIDAVLNTGDFHANLVEAAEIAAALGGGWLRLVWDKDVADRVMVDAVSADSAIGEWRWGQLTAVTFFTEYRKGSGNQEVIRHLERHEPGAVYHGLYVGAIKQLGHPVPLADHPSTEPYAELVNAEGAILTGVDSLTAAYVANMRPQRRWRKVEAISNLGRSDYDGCEPLMDALDETYTSWMRDVRLAKARLLVPEDMLQNLGKGQGVTFDVDQEVFVGLNIMQTKETPQAITPQQFAIRVKEHMDTAADLTEQILDAAGYSASTFGKGSDGVATATEVVSRERKSDRTRDKKTRYWSQALEPLLTTWLELDGSVFGGGAKGAVEVKWADTTQPDPEVLSRTIETLNRAVAVSSKTKVAMLHPDWDEGQIDAEVALIADVPDLGPFPTPPDNGGGTMTPEEIAAMQRGQ